jgi:hypothetical protein
LTAFLLGLLLGIHRFDGTRHQNQLCAKTRKKHRQGLEGLASSGKEVTRDALRQQFLARLSVLREKCRDCRLAQIDAIATCKFPAACTRRRCRNEGEGTIVDSLIYFLIFLGFFFSGFGLSPRMRKQSALTVAIVQFVKRPC